MKKIVGILIVTLLIATALPVSAFVISKEKESIKNNENIVELSVNNGLLLIERNIQRPWNYWDVDLVLHTPHEYYGEGGNNLIYGLKITTWYKGYHCTGETEIIKEDDKFMPNYEMTVSYEPESQICRVEYYFSVLDSSCVYRIRHNVVPVLHHDWGEDQNWETGSLDVTYKYGHYEGYFFFYESFHEVYTSDDPNIDDIEEVEYAMERFADYLIVTNPYNLFYVDSDKDAVNNLLCTMAQLAKEKEGVLGFLYMPLQFWGDFTKTADIVCGDLDNDGYEEIMVGDRKRADEMARIFNNRGELIWKGEFGSISEGAGDVSFLVGKFSHYHTNMDYIAVVTEWGPGEVMIFRWTGNGFMNIDQVHDERARWDDGDGFACGNVLDDSISEVIDEIIIADGDDSNAEINIFQNFRPTYNLPEFGFRMSIPDTGFETGDQIACGHLLNNDLMEEIFIFHKLSNAFNVAIWQYDQSQGQWEKWNEFFLSGTDKNMKFQVANVINEAGFVIIDEIICAEESSGEVIVFQFDEAQHDFIPFRFEAGFDKNDELAVADIDGDYWCDILVGNDKSRNVDFYDMDYVQVKGIRMLDVLTDNIDGKIGDWNRYMGDNFEYLLIVGEADIIPAGYAQYNADEVPSWWYDRYGDEERVQTTDERYVDTDGDRKYPELKGGRIIGNDASLLTKPIVTSLDAWRGNSPNFDLDKAVFYSGWSRGASGTSANIDFAMDVWGSMWIKSRFPNVVNPFKEMFWIHCGQDWASIKSFYNGEVGIKFFVEEYEDFISKSGMKTDVPSLILHETLDADFVYLSAHGNEENLDHLHTNDVDSITYTTKHPIVFTNGCLNGRYIEGYCIAEAFLSSGAAVVIAATEVTWTGYTTGRTKLVFFLDYGVPIGDILFDAKRTASNVEKILYWRATFNCYGDPKYGLS